MSILTLCRYYYAVNALTFETTAYYYTESKLADNHYVRLSKASGAPVFAELLQEGGDGDTAAAGEAINNVGTWQIIISHTVSINSNFYVPADR